MTKHEDFGTVIVKRQGVPGVQAQPERMGGKRVEGRRASSYDHHRHG